MLNKKVSILLPVYNVEEFLVDCMESLINQSYSNIEIIAIDDCSTDNSYNILCDYAKKDNRVKVYKNDHNLKLINTLNKGIELCSGDYIARMDSDDIAYLNRIELQVDHMEKNPDVIMCGTWLKYFGEVTGEWMPEIEFKKINAKLIFQTEFGHPTVMIKSSIIKNLEIKYDLNYIDAEDWELWCRLSKLGKVVNIPIELLHYRKNNNSISYKYRDSQINTSKQILKKNLHQMGISINNQELLEALCFNDKFLLHKYFKEVVNIIKLINNINFEANNIDKKTLFNLLEVKQYYAYFGTDSVNLYNTLKYMFKYSLKPTFPLKQYLLTLVKK